MSVQAPSAVVLVRPHRFAPNPDTAADNAFQALDPTRDEQQIARDAYAEATAVAAALNDAGVRVHIFEDESANYPDSVFPNNWFSAHAGGRVALYPMYSPSRRGERRTDIIEMLKREYRVQDVIDYSGLEYDDIFLEGTGAMVLDAVNRVAYVANSLRANPLALERFCTAFGYEPMAFDAVDSAGVPVYHTNVILCIATEFVLFGEQMIVDDKRRREVVDRLAGDERPVIALSHEQIAHFAGNAIELHTRNGRILAMSRRAEASLRSDQRQVIEQSARILPLDIPTIELAGGSVRCMLAGIHLDPRPSR